ncbi:MAG: hypothetical protein ABIU09_06390 [Pyrinomonadaceae bacterium]
MFYKPKFCCNCGEKVERTDWKIFTSRRFCGVCEIELKEYELFPRLFVGAAVLFGVFGVGNYFAGGGTETGAKAPQLADSPVLKRVLVAESQRSPLSAVDRAPGVQITGSEPGHAIVPDSEGSIAAASKEQPRIRKTASEEPAYFCGALTKKGKPCSRRVKSNERCWQHAGQPSAAAVRKLSSVF